jgi:hemolysin activation/secretion protein
MAPMLGMTAEPRDAGSAEKAREEMLATKIRTERAKVTAEKQRVYEAAVERCKAAEKKYEVARKVARAKNAPKGASEAVKLAKGALNAAEDAVASSEKELKAARKAEGAALDDARTQLKAERRAAEEKKAAEARAAAEKAKVEKAAEAKAAAEKAKAEETSTARGSDIEATLAASGITITGDTDWFGRAKTTDGRTLKQVFAEALAVTNVAGAVEIAQKAARDNGYYLCAVGAEKNGEVKVEAGRFSQVDIRFGKENAPEGRWFTSSQIRERLERSMVQTGEPFNYNALYSQFRDLNSNPDLAANIELRLAQDESEGRALGVDVNVEEEWPFHAIFGIDNFGTDSVEDEPDEWMGRLTLQRLNLWKADHALTLNGFSSINGTLWGGAGSYYIPFTLLDARDAAVTVHGGYSEVDADEVVKNIDVYGTGWFSGVQVSTELLTSLDYSLRLALGVTYRETED